MRRGTILVALAASSLLAFTPARAGEDHERVRAAREAGRILPLADLLARVLPGQPGEVLEVELEEEHGRLVYQIKLLRPDGRLVELYYDAASGAPVADED